MKKYILILMTYSVLLAGCQKMDTVTEETTGSINYQEPQKLITSSTRWEASTADTPI